MITPGTTPEHIFKLPIPVDNVKSIRIFYTVDSNVVLKKETNDITLAGELIRLTLTQEDTLKLRGATKVVIQVQCLSSDNNAFMSYPFYVAVGKSAASEVLT